MDLTISYTKDEQGKPSCRVTLDDHVIEDPRMVEIILPIYSDPIIKIGQLVQAGGGIEQSVMTVVTGTKELFAKGTIVEE